jgi:cytochrome d ubiquinol oxidase subunit I
VDSASPLDAPAVAFSLFAFVVVYFAVFGMGIWYLLRLMKKPPEAHESALDDAPIRSAGITPAPAVMEGASA